MIIDSLCFKKNLQNFEEVLEKNASKFSYFLGFSRHLLSLFYCLDNFLEGCCHLGLNLLMMLVAKCYYVKKVEKKP
jgi:hypothetical protein